MQGAQPGVDMNVNIDVKPIKEPEITNGTIAGEYEVVLTIRSAARAVKDNKVDPDQKPLFIVEAAYAGRYQLAHVPEGELEPFLLIEAPRLLFPFVRQVAADAVMQGGLPPLLMAPIDFVQLYHQRKAQAQSARAAS